MRSKEVGNDGTAPAMAKTAAEDSLYNQITDALCDPKTLAILGGTAVAAAAAVKFGRPLLEMGKAAVPMGDDAVLAAIRDASKGAPQGETTVLGVASGNRIEPAMDVLARSSKPIVADSDLWSTEVFLKPPYSRVLRDMADPTKVVEIPPLHSSTKLPKA